MSDYALHDSTAIPTLSDAPPSSAGRSSHGAEQTQPTHEAISDELKARLDKVIYSDVSRRSQFTARCIFTEKEAIILILSRSA